MLVWFLCNWHFSFRSSCISYVVYEFFYYLSIYCGKNGWLDIIRKNNYKKEKQIRLTLLLDLAEIIW